MIQLGKKTKLTTDVEKAFVELGGGDPNKTLAENELRVALPKAIDIVAEHPAKNLRSIRGCRRAPANREVMTPDFDNINAADLSDDDRLKALYLEAVRRKFWPNNVRAVLEFFCFAEKALYDDKQGTPGKLFYALIKRL